MKGYENLPETYKGLSTNYLIKIIDEIANEGTKAPEEHIIIMHRMLEEYKIGVYADLDEE
ncbi:MAG: hypothetical protein K8R67_03865 [Desulfobacteraceae bacterium]|nr:hypothetical protein [Desulfobacteraceae bacterium]